MNKDPEYLNIFRENGAKIAVIRQQLVEMAKNFAQPEQLDKEAERLIKAAGGEPGFKRVKGYHWSTCIGTNDGFVHCIPVGKIKDGDLVTIDTGMYYHGTTTDVATTFVVGQSNAKLDQFIAVGKKSLRKAIKQTVPGNKIKDITKVLQKIVERTGYSVTRNLCGHGLGETMHESPQIPMYISNDPDLKVDIVPGMVLAVESMYMEGDWRLVTDEDGWSLRTADGLLSGMFEEDVLVTEGGNEVITQL